MRKAILAAILGIFCPANSLLAQKSLDNPATTVNPTYREPGAISQFFGSLEWYIWVGLVAVVILGVVLIYLRKKGQEE